MTCPFVKLIPQLSLLPDGSSPAALHIPGTSSPLSPVPSGMATPSFAPNAPPDHIPAAKVTVPELIAAAAAPGHSTSGRRAGLTVDDIDLPNDLDWELPISELLKVGTQRAHADAETSEGAKQLVKGALGLEEYIRWNVILWRVYDALELALNEHADDPVLSPMYDPRLLARSGPLASDITHLLTLLPASSSSSSPIPPSALSSLPPSAPLPPFPLPSFLLPLFTAPPAPLAAYLTHLRSLSASADKAAALLAHAYVRYLGDMSGGQFIAARVKRSYSLKRADGLRFYHFDQDGKGAEAFEGESMAECKRRLAGIKDWYRRGMNEGVGEDKVLKMRLVREANLAFALNTHLFSLIRPTPSPAEVEAETDSPAGQQASTSMSVAASPSDKPAPLRYYEIREQERQRQRATKSAAGRPSEKRTWRDTVERIALAVVAVLVGQAVARFVLPWLQQRGYGYATLLGK